MPCTDLWPEAQRSVSGAEVCVTVGAGVGDSALRVGCQLLHVRLVKRHGMAKYSGYASIIHLPPKTAELRKEKLDGGVSVLDSRAKMATEYKRIS